MSIPEHDPDAPARAELARLLLEGARRLRLKRQAADAPPQPPAAPAFTEEELRRRPRYRGARRRLGADDGR